MYNPLLNLNSSARNLQIYQYMYRIVGYCFISYIIYNWNWNIVPLGVAINLFITESPPFKFANHSFLMSCWGLFWCTFIHWPIFFSHRSPLQAFVFFQNWANKLYIARLEIFLTRHWKFQKASKNLHRSFLRRAKLQFCEDDCISGPALLQFWCTEELLGLCFEQVLRSIWVWGRKQQWHRERRVLDATNLHEQPLSVVWQQKFDGWRRWHWDWDVSNVSASGGSKSFIEGTSVSCSMDNPHLHTLHTE